MAFLLYNKHMKKILEILKENVKTFVVYFLSIYFIINFVFMAVIVEGSSMEPTLHNNDYGLGFILKKNIGIKRFDVVVIKSDKTKYNIVKRIIGLPNDVVEVKDNHLYINGQEYEEDYLNDDTYTSDFSVELKDDEYFVLGDHREVSKDSRYYGSFKKEDFLCSGMFIIYPFEHFGYK